MLKKNEQKTKLKWHNLDDCQATSVICNINLKAREVRHKIYKYSYEIDYEYSLVKSDKN